MKKTALLKLLRKNGWTYLRPGGDHDVYAKGDERVAIPRHSEIKEGLARRIIKEKGLK